MPTIYEPLHGRPISTNQYSYASAPSPYPPRLPQLRHLRHLRHTTPYPPRYTELFRTTSQTDKLPAVFFHYELSPIMVKLQQERRALGPFLTGLCAIVGGVFTVAGMIDKTLHRLTKVAAK